MVNDPQLSDNEIVDEKCVYDYAASIWIISASSGGSACWYQANGLPKGTYMAYFCTEDTPYGRKLSTSYYNFTVN